MVPELRSATPGKIKMEEEQFSISANRSSSAGV